MCEDLKKALVQLSANVLFSFSFFLYFFSFDPWLADVLWKWYHIHTGRYTQIQTHTNLLFCGDASNTWMCQPLTLLQFDLRCLFPNAAVVSSSTANLSTTHFGHSFRRFPKYEQHKYVYVDTRQNWRILKKHKLPDPLQSSLLLFRCLLGYPKCSLHIWRPFSEIRGRFEIEIVAVFPYHWASASLSVFVSVSVSAMCFVFLFSMGVRAWPTFQFRWCFQEHFFWSRSFALYNMLNLALSWFFLYKNNFLNIFRNSPFAVP